MKIIKNLGYISGQVGILGIFHIALMSWIARSLGPEGVGTYALTISIVQIFLCLLIYGLQPAAARFIPQYLVTGENKRLAILILNLYLWRIILGVIAGLVLYLSKNFIADFYRFEFLREALGYGSILLFLYGIFYLTASCIQGFQKFRELFIYQSLFVMVTFLGTVFFFKYGSGILSPLRGMTIGLVISILCGIVIIIFSLPFRRFPGISMELLVEEGRSLIRYAFPAGVGFIFVLLIDNMGNLVVARFASVATVGYFAFSYRLANYFSRANSIWETLFLPKFSEIFSKEKKEYLTKLFSSLLKNLFFLNIIGVGIILFFSPYIVTLLGGEKFSRALILFQIFAVINIIRGMNPAINSLYYTYHRTPYLARISFSKCIMDIILLIVIVPRFGVVAGAVAILFSWLTVFYYNIYLVRKTLAIEFSKNDIGLGFLIAMVMYVYVMSIFFTRVGSVFLLFTIVLGFILILKERREFFFLLKSI